VTARPAPPLVDTHFQAPAAAGAAPDDMSMGVRLGFADGSDVQLAPDHPHSLALKAVADVLLHKGPFHRRVS
jgi:hypothetical protein